MVRERGEIMQIRSFYRNQRELAFVINEIIDAYWNEEILEDEMIEGINKLFLYNSDKILKDSEYTKVIQQQCGKKRLNVISKIINVNLERGRHNV